MCCTDEIIPVQEWMAIAGMTQPLAQRCERDGSIVSKETVVETVRRNLAELRARRNDEHGLSGGVTRPSEPGPTTVANEAAPHQTDADTAFARGPSSSDLIMARIDWSDLDHGFSDFDHPYDDDDDFDHAAPGYNDGLDDGALPETELTAEGRSVRRRHIKKIRSSARSSAVNSSHDIGQIYCR